MVLSREADSALGVRAKTQTFPLEQWGRSTPLWPGSEPINAPRFVDRRTHELLVG